MNLPIALSLLPSPPCLPDAGAVVVAATLLLFWFGGACARRMANLQLSLPLFLFCSQTSQFVSKQIVESLRCRLLRSPD